MTRDEAFSSKMRSLGKKMKGCEGERAIRKEVKIAVNRRTGVSESVQG